MTANQWAASAGIVVAVIAWNGAARGAELTETRCIVLAEKPDGKVDTLPGAIAVLVPTRTSPTFSLTLPPGYRGASVLCGRSDIVPSENDWKVLDAGYPLFISVAGDGKPDRTITLEEVKGRLQVQFSEGAVTAEDETRLQARLDQLQTAIQDAFMARKAQH